VASFPCKTRNQSRAPSAIMKVAYVSIGHESFSTHIPALSLHDYISLCKICHFMVYFCTFLVDFAQIETFHVQAIFVSTQCDLKLHFDTKELIYNLAGRNGFYFDVLEAAEKLGPQELYLCEYIVCCNIWMLPWESRFALILTARSCVYLLHAGPLPADVL